MKMAKQLYLTICDNQKVQPTGVKASRVTHLVTVRTLIVSDPHKAWDSPSPFTYIPVGLS